MYGQGQMLGQEGGGGAAHLQQRGQAELRRHLLDDLHDHEVLVDLGRHRAVERGELVLVVCERYGWGWWG